MEPPLGKRWGVSNILYSRAAEPLGDSLRGKVGRFAEPRGVARLDLVT
jgi:hypothetical protein